MLVERGEKGLELYWLEYLRELHLLSIVVRVVMAMLLGGILGIERGRKKRPAGFRTYMLVCLSSAMVMMTNQYVVGLYGMGDPVRMGSQVISGIGFLGAGTIIFTGRNQVRGITTAAGLWSAACGGLAIGIGFYEGAAIGGFAVYIIMSLMHYLDEFIHKHSSVIEIYSEFDGKDKFSEFMEYLRSQKFDISDVQISKNKFAKGTLCAILTLHSLEKRSVAEMMRIINEGPQSINVEKIS